MREVYIVKQAIATGLGNTVDETWEGLVANRSALAAVTRFPTDRLSGHRASCISDLRPLVGENRVCALARRALEQVAPVPEGTCIVWAGIKGNAEYIDADQEEEMPYLPEQYLRWAAEALGMGATLGFDINAACASSTVGMAIGAQKIARGEYGAVLVCASDVVSRFIFTGFSSLKALSPTKCRPFDRERDGMCMGDGAVAILLADGETAHNHRLDRLAKLSGWGISNDAAHITAPASDGAGLAMAIETALAMGGVKPEDVEAFCAHGTGTLFNDSMELAAIDAVFGDRRFPLFSIKGAIGHTLGAAGGIDAAICVRALADRLIPPTVGLKGPEPRAAGRVSAHPQPFGGRTLLTSNSGFGGVNAALILNAVAR
jgi:3-oxoacyl-[acyl-carrier-protein] synthase II